MKPNRNSFTKPIQNSLLNAARRKLFRPLNIFIAGPYIEKNWTDSELNSKSPSAKLRISIIEYINSKYKHEIILGEHRGVTEIGDESYRSMSSVLLTEIDLVNESDAIIMIPSSPGSFCELGAWSRDEDLCRKMLILADRDHEHQNNYLTLGVFKTASHFSAEIKWINYNDPTSSFTLIQSFIDRSEDRAMARMTLNGGR